MTDSARPYKRIATEEGWATPEMMQMYLKILETRSIDDPGFYSLWGFFGQSQAPRAQDLFNRIQDMGERRLGDMDATGIDMQLLLLTSPGVQVFDGSLSAAQPFAGFDLYPTSLLSQIPKILQAELDSNTLPAGHG